jgi:hypothetical protein
MKPIYLLIVLISLSINAQVKLSGRNYFDSNWNLSSQYNFQYYREVYKYPSGYYIIYDYYKDGTKQCESYVDTYDFSCGKHPIDCGAKNGYSKWFYYNGNLSSKHRYSNGMLISNESWDIYGNPKSTVSMNDLKQGIETLHEAVKLYKTLTKD